MAMCQTQNFGHLEYSDDAVLEFPAGLPGFEQEHHFIALDFPLHHPLIFLQSLATPGLCFVTLPVLVVEPQYQLLVTESDRELLGLPLNRQPRIGEDVLCLTLLSIRETGTSANLLAPVVVNLKTLRALQSIAADCAYPIQQPLCEEVPV